ncbi:hypothetical protein Lfu02_10270 [Longispora fulva]|uniref:Secreted protein n=1 Tax=Longispora fulva TaxID=619741 RepID=A0A8J7G9I5_9ACTN|nr:hypothetical protein [Longispora fulva]MBG6135110.1 hypothetical protein [Longispora fulva]GIG56655.1 hypothetical protein Lfu02_10270 [Longispora fulva]
MRKTLAISLAAAGAAAALGAFLPTAAQAAYSGSCTEVHVATATGKFDGWNCTDSTGTAVYGRLADTKIDGKCTALAVNFTVEGLKTSYPVCDGLPGRFANVASKYQGVISIGVLAVDPPADN